jgi:predicted transposase YbfD/YdcC
LREDVELFVAEQKAADFKDARISRDETVDDDHGRIETRTTTVIHDVAWLQERHGWPGLKTVVIVQSTREIGGKIERETRFYITSMILLANVLAPIVRSHWAIENSLHWVMDIIFRDDDCRVRTDHAPASLTSPPSNTWLTTSSERPPAKTRHASGERSLPGTTIFSQAS